MAKKRPQPKVNVGAQNALIISCGARVIWVTPKQARALIDQIEEALNPIELAAAFPPPTKALKKLMADEAPWETTDGPAW